MRPHRWLRWGLVLLWVSGIFIFSARANPLGPLARSGQSGLIGRALHIAEYAGLTLLLYWALANPTQSMWHTLSYVVGLTLAHAIFDEGHQALVPARTCSLADVGYDLFGMALALGGIWLWERGRQGDNMYLHR
jgi:VanZ family protein